jgi:hypothetical protein
MYRGERKEHLSANGCRDMGWRIRRCVDAAMRMVRGWFGIWLQGMGWVGEKEWNFHPRGVGGGSAVVGF